VLRSEWTKLRSVRSTYWSLLAAAAAIIGLSAIVCAIYVAKYDSVALKDRATFDPASFSLIGGVLGQLAIAVLGVLVIGSEYTSGMIRTTFAAVPSRLTVLIAKAAVFAGVTLVVMTAASFVAFFTGQAILSTKGIGVGLDAPGALRVVVGTGLYLAVLGILALGLGSIIRKTAGAITAVFGLLFILPAVAALLPSSLSEIPKFLPGSAGQALISGTSRAATELSPWIGFAVFCVYAVVAVAIGGALMIRRDA
jgi:ABC-type transport system involved in multi-copper enzyme maturation permease subunit